MRINCSAWSWYYCCKICDFAQTQKILQVNAKIFAKYVKRQIFKNYVFENLAGHVAVKNSSRFFDDTKSSTRLLCYNLGAKSRNFTFGEILWKTKNIVFHAAVKPTNLKFSLRGNFKWKWFKNLNPFSWNFAKRNFQKIKIWNKNWPQT